MDELSSTTGAVALAAAGVALIALIWVVVLTVQLRRLKAAQSTVLGEYGMRDLAAHAAELDTAFRALHSHVDDVHGAIDERLGVAETRLDHSIAFRSLAFMQLGKQDEARQAIAMLPPAGKGGALADAWGAVVAQQMNPASVEPRKLLELCQKAAMKDSEGGYLRYFMGQAYAQLDEPELAIEVWQRLAVQNPTWSLPLIRLSDTRLAKGRYAMAMYAAQEAVRRSPGSALSAINLAKVWAANVENGQAERPDELLLLISSIRKELPNEEQTLSMQISLLGSMGKKSEATAEIKKVLAAKDAPSEQSLLRLAAVSRAYDLGVADACFDRSEQAHGPGPAGRRST